MPEKRSWCPSKGTLAAPGRKKTGHIRQRESLEQESCEGIEEAEGRMMK